MDSDNNNKLDVDYSVRKQRGNKSCLVTALFISFGGIVLIGILAAIAIPAFQKYIMRSKAAEAPLVVGKLQFQAIQYFEGSSADGACQFPPSANPVPEGQECCDNVGPSDGEDWTPPAQTWNQQGWKALAFEKNEPSYFAYQTINKKTEEGNDLMELRAFADFQPGGPRHTYSVTIEGHKNDQGECVANAQAPVISNEMK